MEDSAVFFDPALVDIFVGMAGSLQAEIGEAEDALLERKLDGLIDRYFSADLGEAPASTGFGAHAMQGTSKLD